MLPLDAQVLRFTRFENSHPDRPGFLAFLNLAGFELEH